MISAYMTHKKRVEQETAAVGNYNYKKIQTLGTHHTRSRISAFKFFQRLTVILSLEKGAYLPKF